MKLLNLAGALGAMKLMRKAAGCLNAIGISEEEYRLLTQHEPWIGQEHSRVRRTLDNMIWGSLDIAGLPRLQPPAEYLAAVIATFVSGTNALAACRLLEGLPPADELIENNGKAKTAVMAEHLFAFLLCLTGDESSAKQVYEKQLGIRADETMEVPINETKKRR